MKSDYKREEDERTRFPVGLILIYALGLTVILLQLKNYILN